MHPDPGEMPIPLPIYRLTVVVEADWAGSRKSIVFSMVCCATSFKGVPHRGRKQISAISAVRFTTLRLESPALSATWLVVIGAAIEDGVGEIP